MSDLEEKQIRDKLFKPLIGNWKGTAKTWFKPDELGDTSEIKGSIKEILDGLFLLHEYEGSLMGQTMKGIAIYGFNTSKSQFECAWIDNQHQGSEIMLSKGNISQDTFSVLGHYTTFDQTETWGWRTEIKILDERNIVIRYYNISPKEDEYVGVEITYKKS